MVPLVLLLATPVWAQDVALSYTLPVFNSDTCCWRRLSADGKHQQAGDLVVAYLHSHSKADALALRWHAGQLYAQTGNTALALKYFRKTYNIFYRVFGGADGTAWYYLAKGTTAFLKRDRKQLQRIIKSWNKRLPKDVNYQQLVLLSDNWEKSYLQALK